MSNYNDIITELQEKLEHNLEKRKSFRNQLGALTVGDTVYEGGVYEDFYPQIVKEIDIEGCRILTLEKSINKLEWVTSFHIKDANGKFTWIH